MRNFQKLVAVIALSGLCFAAPVPSDSDAPKKSTKKHAATVVKKDLTAEQLKELKQQMEQQQAATQQLQEQLKQTQQQLQSTQQQLTQAQATANAANAKASTVETNTTVQVQKVQSDLSDVKTALNTTEVTVAKDEKKVEYLEHPASIAYKGIRITPGGYLEMTGFYRSHATLSDQATPFSGIPLEGWAGGSASAAQSADNPRLSEVGFTARDSRITLRADADAGKTKLAGYFEMDFFGTSPTANYSQTSSYTPRLRQAWGRAKFANGWTITGGQMWNLVTLNRKGTDADNSNLWIPNIMEAQYSVGYDWARFAEFRLSKQIGKNFNFALGVAQPTMLSSANNETGSVAGVATLGTGLLGNSLVTGCSSTLSGTTVSTICTNSPLYSTNLAPDLIVKLAYDDEKLGHYEIKALGRAFRNRVTPGSVVDGVTIATGYNNTVYGQGFGAGAVIPVIAKKVDFIVQGLYGKGISRYEDSGQYDTVIRLDGDHSMQPLKSYSYLAGFETHPVRKVEIDALFGQEHYYQDLYPVFGSSTGAVAGYGAPSTSVGGCFFENAAQAVAAGVGDACAPNNKTLWNAKLYGYYDLYKGPMGTLRYGAEVDYIERTTWAGVAGTTAAPFNFQAKGNDKTGFVTMRYIFP
jgi:hypothetical protein